MNEYDLSDVVTETVAGVLYRTCPHDTWWQLIGYEFKHQVHGQLFRVGRRLTVEDHPIVSISII